MHPLVRLAGVVALLGVLGGLSVHYADDSVDHSPYPVNEDLATDYGTYVGEETRLFGTVKRVDEGARRATIRVDSEEGPFEITVEGFDASVRPGGVVQVYGTLREDRVVEAANVEVVNPAGGSKTYKYAVSAVGAVLVLALFFSHWRFDPDAVAFEVRSDG